MSPLFTTVHVIDAWLGVVAGVTWLHEVSAKIGKLSSYKLKFADAALPLAGVAVKAPA